MSRQIAVRLDDNLVDFIDSVVDAGEQRSRAAVVTKALERERRRAIALQDARILMGSDPDEDLEALARHVAAFPSRLG